MSTKYNERKPDEKKSNSVAILAPGMGTRISEAARRIGTRKSAASAAHVSTDSLQRYIRGDVQPTFEFIVGLAAAANVSLEWLATGAGPGGRGKSGAEKTPGRVGEAAASPYKQRVCALDTLHMAVKAVEEGLAGTAREMTPDKMADLVVAVYELLEAAGGDTSSQEKVLRLIRSVV